MSPSLNLAQIVLCLLKDVVIYEKIFKMQKR